VVPNAPQNRPRTRPAEGVQMNLVPVSAAFLRGTAGHPPVPVDAGFSKRTCSHETNHNCRTTTRSRY
jgi:hypothetical protein